MQPKRGLLTIACLVVTWAGAATPAEADWLVTVDGVEIETRGPWRVEGRNVVFTAANGRLTSLRQSECDLEASVSMTRERARARRVTEPPPPRRKSSRPPAMVLTDADVGHVRPRAEPEPPAGGEAAETDAEPTAAPPEKAAPPQRVVIGDWSFRDESDGIALRGQVRNESRDVAGRLQVLVTFKDEDGETIATQPAALSTKTLKPGQKAEFVVPPFGIYTFGSIDFEVRHFTLLTGAKEPTSSGER